MKYSELVQRPLPLIAVRRQDAADMVGGETILEELIAKQGLRPARKQHKLTVFDVNDLQTAWEKLKMRGQCPDHSEGA